ncbi:hypothetical protein HMPREF1316_2049 [Olsenella profusa F0195]|uniref:Uncharacterized protein n=2 Tax=Olsenella profusa TaxID=138595 RepID=U2TWT5_9ACTN|nr:hypothetical protein HMPREF1316_2049 [Olsenella profusa F0195]
MGEGMARTFRDERDYRDVQENARGSWGLTLAGLLLMGVGIFVCATGDLAHILVLMLVVVLLLGGVALLYVGSSLRRDARNALLRHQEMEDPWGSGK